MADDEKDNKENESEDWVEGILLGTGDGGVINMAAPAGQTFVALAQLLCDPDAEGLGIQVQDSAGVTYDLVISLAQRPTLVSVPAGDLH